MSSASGSFKRKQIVNNKKIVQEAEDRTQTSLGLSGPAIYCASIFETITVNFTGEKKIQKNGNIREK